MGISGLDLLRESTINLQKKIEVKKKLDFGTANVVVAIPNDWIDVQTVADLEEVSFDFRDKKNIRLRVATKYPNLTNNFLVSKGVTQYKLVPSLGATETYPFIGSSEIITDITSTGKTLKDNNLRVLKDGLILKSLACVLISKKKAAILQPFLNSLI
jgi:ATP phosphoribosyltransferase